MTMTDISTRAAINAYFAYMLGGMLRRLGCRVRPYEREPGAADRAVEAGLVSLRTAFLGERDKLEALREVVARFRAIPTARRERPKVAIFGDLYVRDNEVFNQGLVSTIERHGGEVVTTPFNEYMKIIADLYFRKWLREGRYVEVLKSSSLLATVKMLERKYMAELETVLGPPRQVESRRPEDVLATFRVTPHHTGESFDNLLKVFHLAEQYPDLALLVQASPAFCCPALVTEAMAQDIERVTGIPVVSLTYDGTASSKNDAVIPYLTFPRRQPASAVSEAG
jgi:predicted nucleotide-binding protein (sugar kinase/HSP70/actin superfamily)